jgi:hypothetical protein
VIYLLDTSALVRLLRDPKLQEAWYDAIDGQPRRLGRRKSTTRLAISGWTSEFDRIGF